MIAEFFPDVTVRRVPGDHKDAVAVNVTLARKGSVYRSIPLTYVAMRADIPELAEIARRSFEHDHWHRDPKTAARADDYKAEWITNCLYGRADMVFVERDEQGLMGFIACTANDETGAAIDLIAVRPDMRRCGIGRSLVETALSYYCGKPVTVTTQATNAPALALYRKLGFVETGRVSIYHDQSD